ncbi:GNAT family N-acetyltransferase [Sphingomonas nostoxanthinifaciens]|uniref:GNAT family N-acetyltransferase n=1 Tax=Sphingomonas nostoxanthinifaciens TaxID=2872652 RepID=UPI001CC21A1C|nr:GNAT family N-acetyltransferase [Sphingomonas nostoxanthinifaciens]UAK23950.1 GNAT family N-acetyltransferase [Sphingomonas nostoxanthinifaciens]
MTQRLRLRPHRLDDLAGRAAMVAEPSTMHHVGGAQDAEENHARILRYAGHWALRGFGAFAIEEQESGRFAGECGLAFFHRGLGDDFDHSPEAMWLLAGWAEGHGFAYEAMSGVIDWHDRHREPQPLVCLVAVDNVRSLVLAARLGFHPFRDALYRGHPVVLHRRTAPFPNGGEPG